MNHQKLLCFLVDLNAEDKTCLVSNLHIDCLYTQVVRVVLFM